MSRWKHRNHTYLGIEFCINGFFEGAIDPPQGHFTVNFPMQKANFTLKFVMPTKFISCFMAMAVHDNSSKDFFKAMPKTDPSIKSRPWKSIVVSQPLSKCLL